MIDIKWLSLTIQGNWKQIRLFIGTAKLLEAEQIGLTRLDYVIIT